MDLAGRPDAEGQLDEVGRPDAADMEEGHGEARLAQGTFIIGVDSVFSRVLNFALIESQI